MSFWIVTQTHVDSDRVYRCLESLIDAPPDRFSVVVVDHTPDGRAGTEHFAGSPSVTFLRADPSLWWAGTTNIGIKHALSMGASHIMLLNSDCVIEQEHVVRLFGVAAQSNAIIAPVQQDIDTGVLTTARAWTALPIGFPTIFVERSRPRDGLIRTRMIGGGRGVVIPASVFHEVGFLADGPLPHYYADHDFYLRCRRAGIPLLICTDATVQIDGATSSMAAAVGELQLSQFRESLQSRRSHRNLHALAGLFRRNYPIRQLWWIGLSLAVARYLMVWSVLRLLTLVRHRVQGSLRRRPDDEPPRNEPQPNQFA